MWAWFMVRFSTLQQNKWVIFISSLLGVKMLCLSCDRVWFWRQMCCLYGPQLQMDLWAAFNMKTIERQIFGASCFGCLPWYLSIHLSFSVFTIRGSLLHKQGVSETMIKAFCIIWVSVRDKCILTKVLTGCVYYAFSLNVYLTYNKTIRYTIFTQQM